MLLPLIVALHLATSALATPIPSHTRGALVLVDTDRKREVPVEIYFPKGGRACDGSRPCGVAFLSPGAGIEHTSYAFIAAELNDRGYLVVSVRHELPSDTPPADKGSIYETRLPVWRRGAENLRFAAKELAAKFPSFDWKRVLLIGHSNGGDISALFATEHPDSVSVLVTLDNRRMPIPRRASPKILSIRASDLEADAGVLPTPEEQQKFGIAIVKIPGARHDDMNDAGSPELKRSILTALGEFLAAIS